jgi:hypothetical protein
MRRRFILADPTNPEHAGADFVLVAAEEEEKPNE